LSPTGYQAFLVNAAMFGCMSNCSLSILLAGSTTLYL
jgi:hypothetical protein